MFCPGSFTISKVRVAMSLVGLSTTPCSCRRHHYQKPFDDTTGISLHSQPRNPENILSRIFMHSSATENPGRVRSQYTERNQRPLLERLEPGFDISHVQKKNRCSEQIKIERGCMACVRYETDASFHFFESCPTHRQEGLRIRLGIRAIRPFVLCVIHHPNFGEDFFAQAAEIINHDCMASTTRVLKCLFTSLSHSAALVAQSG